MLYVVCYHMVKMIHDQKPGTEEHFVEFKVPSGRGGVQRV